MGVFEQFPMLAVFVIVVVIALVVSTVRSRQPGSQVKGPAACPQCGATPPGHANFCNRCGHKL